MLKCRRLRLLAQHSYETIVNQFDTRVDFAQFVQL